MAETISSTTNPSDLASSTIPYLVGSNGIMGAVLLYLIKRWVNGMFSKLAKFESMQSDMAEIKFKMNHLGEQLAELKYPINRVSELDKSFAVLDTKVTALHRRLDGGINPN